MKNLTQFNKPYIISLSGLSLADNIPNKPIIAYDFEQMDLVLTSHPRYHTKPLGIKFAPYFDISHYERVVSIIAQYQYYLEVTTNTMGNGLFIDSESECAVIAANSGFGGIGGGFIKPISLANVRTIFLLLQKLNREDIDIIGVGGVYTGKDAFELILCGAKAVQVSTCHWIEGSSCFDRISKELTMIMKSKGYTTIENFRGKLKSYDPKLAAATRNIYQLKPKAAPVPDKKIDAGSMNVVALQWAVIVLLIAVILFDKLDLNNHFDSIRKLVNGRIDE